MSGSGGLADRLRMHVADVLVWPLWRLERLGTAAANLGDRIVWWGERARTQR